MFRGRYPSTRATISTEAGLRKVVSVPKQARIWGFSTKIGLGWVIMLHVVIHTAQGNNFTGPEHDSREPTFRLMLFLLLNLSVPFLPNVLQYLLHTLRIAHTGFPSRPIDDDRPLEHTWVLFGKR